MCARRVNNKTIKKEKEVEKKEKEVVKITPKLSNMHYLNLLSNNLGLPIPMIEGAINEVAGGGMAGVTSFNGRTDVVVAENGDYSASQVGAIDISKEATYDNYQAEIDTKLVVGTEVLNVTLADYTVQAVNTKEQVPIPNYSVNPEVTVASNIITINIAGLYSFTFLFNIGSTVGSNEVVFVSYDVNDVPTDSVKSFTTDDLMSVTSQFDVAPRILTAGLTIKLFVASTTNNEQEVGIFAQDPSIPNMLPSPAGRLIIRKHF